MDEDESESKPTSAGRFLEMARTSASMAGDYATSTVKSWFQSDEAAEESRAQLQRRNGERLAETLGDLKGAAMKVGQMASVATDVLPEEFAEPLEQLRDEAPPMAWEEVAAQIEAELGEPPESLLEDVETEPFASASIGQVHRATTRDGRNIVLKVQYPGVDDSVESDLAQLRMALRASGLIDGRRREAFDRLFDEIEARLKEELDYRDEADHVRLFGEMYADREDVVIPSVVDGLSSRRVLALSEERGDSLETVCQEYAWATKDALGETLFGMFAEQLFDERVFHADPNPANYAFRPDGTVVVYDFGCVKRLEPDQHAALVAIMEAMLAKDWGAVEDAMMDLGGRVPDRPAPPEEVYETWYSIFVEPVVDSEYYDYGEGVPYRRLKEDVDIFIEHQEKFQPPPGGVYIDRTVAGMHNLLRTMEPEVPCERIMREALDRSDAG